MSYNKTKERLTYCDNCGVLVSCSVYVSDYMEPETGYVDSVDLCGNCERNNSLWDNYIHFTNSD
jgi:hypothetical protein